MMYGGGRDMYDGNYYDDDDECMMSWSFGWFPVKISSY